MGSKYKYDGISLDDYCASHGLNVGTQRSRIRLYIRKHPGVSEDAATKYVIDHRDRVLYKYNGMSLADYCRENDLNYATMVGRIVSLQDKNSKLSNEEATRMAVEEFTDSRFKYFLDGKTLEEYCAEHGLNADTQRNRIKIYADEHPKLPIDEVIKAVLSTCGKVYYKYGYGEMSLADYCRENGLNYNTMAERALNIKRENPSLTDEEATKIAVEEFTDRRINGCGDREIKYFYSGMPLIDYCRIHPEYNYISIRIYIMRKLAKNPEATIQEVIDSYFLVEHQSHTYHFVDGIPLYVYCEQNGIVYNSIMKSLSRMRKNPKYSSLTEQERLKIAIENYQNYVGCYLYYKGITLYAYCKDNNYSYNTVYNYIFALLKEHHDITLEEAMDIAFSNIKRNGIKYYYKEEPLITYCRRAGLNEKYVRERVTDNLNKSDVTMEEAVEESISYYTRKKYYDDLRKIFQYLKETEHISEERLKEILDFLNIDYENVIQLLECQNNLSTIVNLIWYFHDNEEGEKLSISMNTLKSILEKSKLLEEISDVEVCDIDIIFLIGVYKAGLFDTRYLILMHQEPYHYSRIRSYLFAYGLEENEDFKRELNSALNLQLLELIDRNYNNNLNMVVSYLNKSINGFLSAYFVKYMQEKRIVSLEQPIGNHTSNKTLKVMDKIVAPEVDSDEFSEEMKDLLNTLDEKEKMYITYKFQLGLSNEEIAAILKLDLTDLSSFSDRIFSKLRNSEEIKKFML